MVSSGPRQFDNGDNYSVRFSENSSSKIEQSPTLKEKQNAMNELKITVYLVPGRL